MSVASAGWRSPRPLQGECRGAEAPPCIPDPNGLASRKRAPAAGSMAPPRGSPEREDAGERWTHRTANEWRAGEVLCARSFFLHIPEGRGHHIQIYRRRGTMAKKVEAKAAAKAPSPAKKAPKKVAKTAAKKKK